MAEYKYTLVDAGDNPEPDLCDTVTFWLHTAPSSDGIRDFSSCSTVISNTTEQEKQVMAVSRSYTNRTLQFAICGVAWPTPHTGITLKHRLYVYVASGRGCVNFNGATYSINSGNSFTTPWTPTTTLGAHLGAYNHNGHNKGPYYSGSITGDVIYSPYIGGAATSPFSTYSINGAMSIRLEFSDNGGSTVTHQSHTWAIVIFGFNIEDIDGHVGTIYGGNNSSIIP